jgi:glycolate oxidase FAD binding subunit
MDDKAAQLQQQVRDALKRCSPLCIHGGNSKAFYGRTPQGEPLDVSGHAGVSNYAPTELVITARAGTRLKAIKSLLAENNQMLAFEPPGFGDNATLGGTVACNLAGPRRPWAGAARDFVLGTRMINGKGETVHFGGEVMKNVAGYDVSRLMAGAMGTLGVMLEVSLKVLPQPETERTLVLNMTADQALAHMHQWAGQALPVTATSYHDSALAVRVSGTSAAVVTAGKTIGGDLMEDDTTYWRRLREHRLAYFDTDLPVWRLSLASDAPPLALPGEWLYEWNGAQRWLISEAAPELIRAAAKAVGGHATLYRNHGDVRDRAFQPLEPGILKLHQRIKAALDPQGIFNPGRMYAEL